MAAATKKLTLEDVLLPTSVKPEKYHIHLEPDLVACTFSGQETIEIDVLQATNKITMHANKLNVSADASFTSSLAGAAKPTLTSLSMDIASETVTFTFNSDLPVGPARLTINFNGILNDDLAGFYRSKYTLRGETRWMAVTQFEATDARRCFPCWDEPAQKAVFDISITCPADRIALSNGHVTRIDTSADGRKRKYQFAETPRQSTYLVAFIVGDFDVISATGAKDGIITSVYTPPGKAALGQFALDAGVRSIEYLADLFGVPYIGGSKCDHIAIPDFAAGAMENTGCITYREALLLVDDKESSVATKQRVAQVVAHELSHQWFGNHTTMRWWNGLWLNEGFAKFMEYAVTSHLFPQWRTFSHFTAMVQSTAFSLDSMASTHPIEVFVAHPDEINEVFDAISYNKGASVIRMMFDWISHEGGFKGLHAYLTKFAYRNATTEDLWDSLGSVTGLPVREVMRNWVVKPGYPYIAVSTTDKSAGALHRHSLSLQSGRFIAPWSLSADAWPTDSSFASGPSMATVIAMNKDAATTAGGVSSDAEDGTKTGDKWCQDWCIPISIVTGTHKGGASTTGSASTGGGGAAASSSSSGSDATGTGSETVKIGVLSLDAKATTPSTGSADAGAGRDDKLAAMAGAIGDRVAGGHGHWFKLNAGHASFYRTIYDSALLQKLHGAVATPADRSTHPALDVNDRLGVVGDVAAGVSIGASSAVDLIRLLWVMRYEVDYNVWSAMLDGLGGVHSAAEGVSPSLVASLDGFTRALLKPILEYCGWEAKAGEDPNTPLLRATVIRQAALAGEEGVVAEALRRFDAFAAGKEAIAADLRQTVFNTAASNGGAARWDSLLSLFRKAGASGNSEEQRRLMTALGRASGDAVLLQRALDMIFTDEVRSQDAVFLVMAVASNSGDLGRNLTWKLLTNRWDDLMKKFGSGNFLWASIVGNATGNFDSKAMADEITAFFATHPAGSAERKVQQSLESIRSRAWRSAILKNDPQSLTAAIEACA